MLQQCLLALVGLSLSAFKQRLTLVIAALGGTQLAIQLPTQAGHQLIETLFQLLLALLGATGDTL
ncbi:hypothetical protein D3C85_1764700 [compost metagenome]